MSIENPTITQVGSTLTQNSPTQTFQQPQFLQPIEAQFNISHTYHPDYIGEQPQWDVDPAFYQLAEHESQDMVYMPQEYEHQDINIAHVPAGFEQQSAFIEPESEDSVEYLEKLAINLDPPAIEPNQVVPETITQSTIETEPAKVQALPTNLNVPQSDPVASKIDPQQSVELITEILEQTPVTEVITQMLQIQDQPNALPENTDSTEQSQVNYEQPTTAEEPLTPAANKLLAKILNKLFRPAEQPIAATSEGYEATTAAEPVERLTALANELIAADPSDWSAVKATLETSLAAAEIVANQQAAELQQLINTVELIQTIAPELTAVMPNDEIKEIVAEVIKAPIDLQSHALVSAIELAIPGEKMEIALRQKLLEVEIIKIKLPIDNLMQYGDATQEQIESFKGIAAEFRKEMYDAILKEEDPFRIYDRFVKRLKYLKKLGLIPNDFALAITYGKQIFPIISGNRMRMVWTVGEPKKTFMLTGGAEILSFESMTEEQLAYCNEFRGVEDRRPVMSSIRRSADYDPIIDARLDSMSFVYGERNDNGLEGKWIPGIVFNKYEQRRVEITRQVTQTYVNS